MRDQNVSAEEAFADNAVGAKTAPQASDGSSDVIIIGAGPAGLSLACALARLGLSVKLLERQPRAALAEPAPDGREIALTHRAIDILSALAIWPAIAASQVAPIREARVLNGHSPRFLSFDGRRSNIDTLGYLVPNHAIRRAAYQAAATQPAISLLDSVRVERVDSDLNQAQVLLAGGQRLHARLVVAADSRLSDTRRQMGIGADLQDFGRDVIVCHLSHALDHQGIAYECFGHSRTLAMLPLNGRRVSAVVTAPSQEAARLMQLPGQAFAHLLAEQFERRLGEMKLEGERHNYPLVAVYARRFIGRRFALAGDAAVGMHPVTAHGFNLGLYGVDALARALAKARQRGQDIGSPAALEPFEREHRFATVPLYVGTNLLVGLYTDERAPARLARHALLRMAERLPPVKAAITRRLNGPSLAPPAPGGGLRRSVSG